MMSYASEDTRRYFIQFDDQIQWPTTIQATACAHFDIFAIYTYILSLIVSIFIVSGALSLFCCAFFVVVVVDNVFLLSSLSATAAAAVFMVVNHTTHMNYSCVQCMHGIRTTKLYSSALTLREGLRLYHPFLIVCTIFRVSSYIFH